MPYAPRPTSIFPPSQQPNSLGATSSLRHTILSSSSQQTSSTLKARIAAKHSELENLKQLRELSGALAGQMSALEEKLATLRDGTEAVACVLANWDHVLRAISMASMKVPIPKTAEGDETEDLAQDRHEEHQLPVTLVRIPAQSKGKPHPQGQSGGEEVP